MSKVNHLLGMVNVLDVLLCVLASYTNATFITNFSLSETLAVKF
jgi:hypothetical protein